MSRNTGRGKVAYSWISSDPARAGPTLGGGGVVVLGGTNKNFEENLKRFENLDVGNLDV